MEIRTINLTIPDGWNKLNEGQLRYLYALIADEFSSDEVKTLALLKWGGCRVVARNGPKANLMKMGKVLFEVSAEQLAEVLPMLGWMDELPTSPVCLEKIGGHGCVAPDFQGVPFEAYLVVENLYQGFLSTRNDGLLDEIAAVLYPGLKAMCSPAERVSIFYWVSALKDMFAKRFPHLFQLANATAENLLGDAPNIGKRLQNSMDAQIRALTKGDITKESEILSLDTWRALTELNAQAREYAEIQAKYPTK